MEDIHENKLGLKERITEAKEVGIYDLEDNDSVRIVVENAGGSNEVELSVQVDGQSNWKLLKTITGSGSERLVTTSYDKLRIECTTFDGQLVTIVGSGFRLG